MKNIALDIEKVTGFVSKETILGYADKVAAAQKALEEGTAPGNDFLGWLHLPSSITKEFIEDIKATAQYKMKKAQSWKVNNVLAPAEPVNEIKITRK